MILLKGRTIHTIAILVKSLKLVYIKINFLSINLSIKSTSQAKFTYSILLGVLWSVYLGQIADLKLKILFHYQTWFVTFRINFKTHCFGSCSMQSSASEQRQQSKSTIFACKL